MHFLIATKINSVTFAIVFFLFDYCYRKYKVQNIKMLFSIKFITNLSPPVYQLLFVLLYLLIVAQKSECDRVQIIDLENDWKLINDNQSKWREPGFKTFKKRASGNEGWSGFTWRLLIFLFLLQLIRVFGDLLALWSNFC